MTAQGWLTGFTGRWQARKRMWGIRVIAVTDRTT